MAIDKLLCPSVTGYQLSVLLLTWIAMLIERRHCESVLKKIGEIKNNNMIQWSADMSDESVIFRLEKIKIKINNSFLSWSISFLL